MAENEKIAVDRKTLLLILVRIESALQEIKNLKEELKKR
jgi:hypothetical protein